MVFQLGFFGNAGGLVSSFRESQCEQGNRECDLSQITPKVLEKEQAMKKTITISSVVLSVLALMTIPATAGILFDGTGDPTASGLEAINTPDDWQFDTPSVGLLYQQATDNDGGYGLDDIDNGEPDVAAAELDASKGYFVEWKVDLTSSSDGAGWPGYNIGNFAWLEDSSGKHLTLHGDENNTDASKNFSWYTGWDDPAPVGTVDMSGGFHTLRVENPGGDAGTIDFFFDGNQILDDHPMGGPDGGNGQARLMLGNGGASSVGEAVYDYIAINQEIPEPASLALLLMGAIFVMIRRRH